MEHMTKEQLTEKRCKPCQGEVSAFNKDEAAEYRKEVPEWALSDDGKMISRQYVMKNFMAAVQLMDRVAELAEQEQHHPDLHLTGYRNLRIELSTHKIGGLSENDFILAAKINRLPADLKTQ